MRSLRMWLLPLVAILALVCIYVLWFMQTPGSMQSYFLGRVSKAVLDQTSKTGWHEKSVGSFRLRYMEHDLGATKVELVLTGARARVVRFFKEVPTETVVVVYPDLKSLETAVQQDLPDFGVGGALGAIMAVTSPDAWSAKTLANSNVEQIVTHEFTHVVVNQLSGCRAPKWLNEGIAPIVAGQFSPSSRSKVIAQSLKGELYSLAEVDEFFRRPAAYPDKNAGLMYAIAASIVTYIIENHSTAELIQVLKEMSGGKTADHALESVLGMDQTALEVAWRRSLQHT